MGVVIPQFCGLLVLMLILYMSMYGEKLRSRSFNSFSVAVLLTAFNLVLDIISVLLVMMDSEGESLLVDIICKAYLISLIWVGVSVINYLTAMINGSPSKRIPIVVACISSLLVGVLPLGRVAEQIKPNVGGPGVIVAYATAAFLVLYAFVYTLLTSSGIEYSRIVAVHIWLGAWAISLTIQYFGNGIFIEGFVSTLGLLLVFSRLENPALYMDTDSGLFNRKAFRTYLKECFATNNTRGYVCVVLDPQKSLTIKETERLAARISPILKKAGGPVFRTGTYSFCCFTPPGLGIPTTKYIREHFEPICQNEFSYVSMRMLKLESTTFFKNADETLNAYYVARSMYKDSGLDVFDIDYTAAQKLTEKDHLEEEIRMALAEGRIEAWYQPIFDTRERRFTAAEVLARMRRRDGTIVQPDEFIPEAEESGLIIQIGEEIFKQACKFIVRKDVQLAGLQYLEVNLSAAQFKKSDLYESFSEIVQTTGASPYQINLEITESARLDSSKQAMEIIDKFRYDGFTFSLDDFGTG
ncbi:MAG: EAL domain-containing protein, partial [Lachnospiraceae bacterium]|nr:EAL domain-containing protein [Lachnospiraceae bacterium]